MRLLKIATIILFLSSIFAGQLLAQSGPAWLQQGNLQYADKIWAFLEIPNTNIIFAGGRSDRDEAGIWKSTNGGQTWEQKLRKWYSSEGVRQFAFDESRNLIFACISNVNGGYDLEWKTIYYSDDLGETWKYIYHPAQLGYRAGAHSIVLLNNKLYVAFEDRHPENGNDYQYIYSADLLRLDISNANSDYWYWEHCMHYPELDYIMRLSVKDNKIYVFGKDKETDGIRIFIYNTETMGKTASNLGTIQENEKTIKLLKQQQAAFNEEQTSGTTPENIGGEVR
ncbi:glycosyl hydrolase BNR repeat-containing protein [Caldithrix abyssi DSM 13497]|uniref:Glycosyl hydrolase BNR repeat-containing protein n=1 Tax=Caldithrix abyssi DSM 13497 TaxID=880073 RepID=H1XXV1_CALAY|nr:sialidase family protein [Caldithrix abyssi]APF19658.1 hypothetical protein Cabys_2910 [Caldithrix abyssi DSM 13497]EHO39774.1 glycosyl hydrolase BNR repeat-containing protein [Caldithrix abyssi DSM 13497]